MIMDVMERSSLGLLRGCVVIPEDSRMYYCSATASLLHHSLHDTCTSGCASIWATLCDMGDGRQLFGGTIEFTGCRMVLGYDRYLGLLHSLDSVENNTLLDGTLFDAVSRSKYLSLS